MGCPGYCVGSCLLVASRPWVAGSIVLIIVTRLGVRTPDQIFWFSRCVGAQGIGVQLPLLGISRSIGDLIDTKKHSALITSSKTSQSHPRLQARSL